MPTIHPSAVIEPGATIAPDAVIGPYCSVSGKAVIGSGTRLISHVTILNRTRLGAGNEVFPQAVLGAIPQDLKYHGEDSQLVIGNRNQIREAVTMHIGTENGGGLTQVGDDNLIMVACHVAHDCLLGHRIIMANGVGLAGHVVVQDHAVIGGIVGVHHFVTFGTYSFTGGMSRIVHDVPPYMVCEGNPGQVRGVNVIGLERAGFAPAAIQHLKEAHRLLWRAAGDAPASVMQRLEQLEASHGGEAHIQELTVFMRRMAQGIFGRWREAQRADDRRTGAGAI